MNKEYLNMSWQTQLEYRRHNLLNHLLDAYGDLVQTILAEAYDDSDDFGMFATAFFNTFKPVDEHASIEHINKQLFDLLQHDDLLYENLGSSYQAYKANKNQDNYNDCLAFCKNINQ